MTVPWKEGQMKISREEYDLRWEYARNPNMMTEAKFKAEIKEIRERTGKP
jgi:hypothetical protein